VLAVFGASAASPERSRALMLPEPTRPSRPVRPGRRETRAVASRSDGHSPCRNAAMQRRPAEAGFEF
jgi:hypothetical protein